MTEKNKGMKRRGGNWQPKKHLEREQKVKRRRNVAAGYVITNPSVKKKNTT